MEAGVSRERRERSPLTLNRQVNDTKDAVGNTLGCQHTANFIGSRAPKFLQ
ncbi:protein of unknown function [Burkholderia multivorans]